MAKNLYPLISTESAWQRIAAVIRALSPVEQQLDALLGHVLAENIVARENMPPFRSAAMDGYAVIAAEGTAQRCILGEQDAGRAQPFLVTPGTAVRIMTGAPVPEGADAVVPVEQALEEAGCVRFHGTMPSNSFVRPVGQDLAAGDVVLHAGIVLGPPEIGLLATVGRTRVSVHPKPIVAVMATGDELVDPDQLPAPGQIRDSNSHALVAAVAAAGFVPLSLGHVDDDAEMLRAAILEGVSGADMLLTSGGVSMGTRDLIKPLLRELGTVHFGRVAVKPGKPLTFAVVRGTPVFGLPGFPVSSLVSFEQFVRPALRIMAGHSKLWRPQVCARLSHPVRHEADRTEFQRAVVEQRDGIWWAETTGSQVSGRLKSLVGANALLRIPEGVAGLAAGDQVDAILVDQPEVGGNEHTS